MRLLAEDAAGFVKRQLGESVCSSQAGEQPIRGYGHDNCKSCKQRRLGYVHEKCRCCRCQKGSGTYDLIVVDTYEPLLPDGGLSADKEPPYHLVRFHANT